ncbi:DNA translocase FtsK [Cohnella nanjingensis]|nr:DNA translocase FtsK [Cohnella nanjingensis]
MHMIQIELHRDKYLTFITDNEKLVAWLRRKEFVLRQPAGPSFSAVMIDSDEAGYRTAVAIEPWLEQIAEEGQLGPFIVSCHKSSGGRVQDLVVYANGKYDRETIDRLNECVRQSAGSPPGVSFVMGRVRTLLDMDPVQTKDDDLYEEAAALILETRRASVSLLQRRLRIGHARASRLMTLLEERGVVGPYAKTKPRSVLVAVGASGSPASRDVLDEALS